MINLKTYNRSQLLALIQSEEFEKFPFFPISKQRAISHINNPRILEGDTLLILAFENENLAGYIGILPDDLFTEGKKLHFGWLSTIFVHSDFRGKKIALKLLDRACDEYKGNIMLTEFTATAETIYRKSGYFEELESLKGTAFHFLLNLKAILPTKNQNFTKIKPLLSLTDGFGNILLKGFNQISSKKAEFKTVKFLDNEMKDFLKNQSLQSSFKRGISELEWITKFPWVMGGKKNPRYEFSDFDSSFRNEFLKIYDNDQLQTVLMISVRKEVAKLHFCFSASDKRNAAEALQFYTVQNNIKSLISFEEELNDELAKKRILFKKVRTRKFLIHKSLLEQLPPNYRFVFDGGDADAVFT